MDFHSLARRDLQALCKKNKIPANLTNVAMADALQSLKSIEWDEEIRKRLMSQSETIELQHGSPLPRSRRVTALSNDNSGVPMEEIADKEEQMKEALIEAINQTPSTAVRRSTRIQSAMGTRTRARTSAVATGTATRTTAAANGTATRTSTLASGKITSMAGTRTRGGKKEETSAEAVEVAAVTPAAQRSRKKTVETPAQVVHTPAQQRGRKKATETPAPAMIPRSSARPTRQSTRKPAESTKSARVTRRTMTSMILDVTDGKEAQAVADKVEEKKEQTPLEVNAEKVDEVVELVEATKYDSTEKLEVQEEEADQNEEAQVSEEIEPAKELSEDVDLVKEDELMSDEKLNSGEDNPEQAEFTEEKTQEESDSNAVTLISEETDEMPTENVEEDVVEKLNSNLSFVVDSEIPTDKDEEAEEEMLNSEDRVASLVCDEFKDDGSVEQPLEEVNEVGAVTNVEAIPDEVEKEEIEVTQTTLVDSPIMGLVSEVVPENTSDLQDALLSDVTVDNQDAPSDLCFSSPVRAPADVGIEKMLDSVVRHLAKASIKDSAKKTDACCLAQQEEVQVLSNEPSGLVQNENAAKETVDLKNMSLRKLKALYKNSLIEMNSKKAVEEGKRLPLGQLDENLLV